MTRRLALTGVLVLPPLAVVVYVAGLLQGHFLDLESNLEWCRRGPLEYPYLTQRFAPLSSVCHYAGGGREQLVPGWVNPAVALLLLLFVLAVAALARGRRGRTPITVDGTRDDA
ncbi:MAG: hypothetical protein U0Q15_02940 [Kineosporiaceae bacterium]